MKTFWPVMCVFILFQHPAAVASSMSSSIMVNKGQSRNGQEDYSQSKCREWEMFDGTACVCAEPSQSRCRDTGGIVCDNKGGVYKSVCHFALKMCNGQLSTERVISSCGSCDILRLIDESRGPSYAENFVRQGSPDAPSQSITYISSRPDRLSIFYQDSLKQWVIGVRNMTNSNASIIAIVKELSREYPQDSDGDMLVATRGENGLSWVHSPQLKLQCAAKGRLVTTIRHKRFIFFLISSIIVTIGVSATTITLRAVQAKRGCLYYPSVCKLRDEIKNKLEPEVRNLKNVFQQRYGNIMQYKTSVNDVIDRILDIRDRLVRIKELHIYLHLEFSELVSTLGALNTLSTYHMSALANYQEWITILEKHVVKQIGFLYIEFTLLAVTSSSINLAIAGIGALASIALGVVDIVSSVQEEKYQKKRLEEAKSNYRTAKSNILKAFEKVKEFQKHFCKTAITYLQGLSEAGKPYHSLFSKMNDFITKTYVSAPPKCDEERIFSKSSRQTIDEINNTFLSPISGYLRDDEHDLITRVREVNDTNQFLKAITNKIKRDRMEPSKLFSFVKQNKPKLVSKRFRTLFDILVMISEKILPSVSCYWGRNLKGFRSKSLTLKNYLKAPICDCPEITTLVSVIRTKVSNNVIPCEVHQLVKGYVFRSRYSVLRYIADYILPNDNCYWGYDLEAIRKTSENDEVEQADINSAMFNMLKFSSISEINTQTVRIPRKILCQKHKVCSRKWQDFLMCVTSNDDTGKNPLGCSIGNIGSKCIPSQNQHQKCNPKH